MVITTDTTQIARDQKTPVHHAAEPSAQAETGKKRFITEGEKRFDFWAYTGLNYIANVLISIGAIYWVERTKSGHQFLDGFQSLMEKIPKVDGEIARFLARKSFFLSGGSIVLFPIKFMEDRKVEWVKAWNREHYGAHEVASNPDIIQSEREMEEAPRQGWGSIFLSRGLALIPFYAIYTTIWERSSPLSRLTNSNLGEMGKAARKAMEQANPEAYSELTSKGFYIDKPIAAMSRWLGKAWAKLTGNHPLETGIEQLNKQHPGTILSEIKPGNPGHESAAVTLPYYTISEAITSWMVAAAMYPLTKLTAPFTDREYRAEQKESKQQMREETSAPRTQIASREKDYQQRVESAPHQQAIAK